MDAETYATILLEAEQNPAAAAKLIASLYGVHDAMGQRFQDDPQWMGGEW